MEKLSLFLRAVLIVFTAFLHLSSCSYHLMPDRSQRPLIHLVEATVKWTVHLRKSNNAMVERVGWIWHHCQWNCPLVEIQKWWRRVWVTREGLVKAHALTSMTTQSALRAKPFSCVEERAVSRENFSIFDRAQSPHSQKPLPILTYDQALLVLPRPDRRLQHWIFRALFVALFLTLSLPSSKSRFSQPFTEKMYKWRSENW